MPPGSLTISGHLLLPALPRTVRLAPGTLTIRGDTIASIEEGRIDPHADFGGDDFLISPGFVDTHLHLPQFDSIGADGMELLDWLDRIIFPAEAKWADADYAGAMTHRVAQELLSFGTTSIAAYATVHTAAAQAAIDALAAAGLSGHVGQVLMDQNAPPELLRPAREAIPQAAALQPRARTSPAVTPRFAVSCTRGMLEAAGQLAKSTGWLVQTHLAETRRECALVSQLHGGLSYVDVYNRAGLLGLRSVLGHGIWLDAADHAALAQSGSFIAHCPTANTFLSAGTMNRATALAAGVAVCLGTDIGAGPDRSMPRVARAMIEAAKSLGQRPISAAEAWWQITTGNAAAIGLNDVGQLRAGGRADVLVMASTRTILGSPNALAAVLYKWDDRALRHVILGGRCLPAGSHGY